MAKGVAKRTKEQIRIKGKKHKTAKAEGLLASRPILHPKQTQ